MKIKIFNNNKISENNIDDKVVRVKALIVNSKDEILLGEAFGTVQFPGGHLEENESLCEGLIREVREETGIVLKSDYEPFFAIKYFLKDHPVVGNNRSLEIYYFYIFTDESFNLDNIYLDDQERNGDFKLQYVSLKNVKKFLISNIYKNQINGIITNEMLLALKYAKKIHKKR